MSAFRHALIYSIVLYRIAEFSKLDLPGLPFDNDVNGDVINLPDAIFSCGVIEGQIKSTLSSPLYASVIAPSFL